MARNVRKTNKSFLTLQSFLFVVLIAYSAKHLNIAQCLEFSEDEIKAIIEEDEHRGIYRLKNKKEIKRFGSVDYEELKIFCHHGQFLSLAGFWSAATEMRLDMESEYYNVYIANSVSMVQKIHKDHQATWFYSSLPWKAKTLKFSPFERTCVGVLTREEYSISLHIYRVNYWQVLMTISGLILFFYAPSLCRNVFFRYTTGVGTGVFLSLVLFSINLIQWILQFFALLMIYLSSYHQVASLAIALGIVLWSLVPDSLKTKAQYKDNKVFKPKIRLLSEDECVDQSRVVTEKALTKNFKSKKFPILHLILIILFEINFVKVTNPK